MLPGLYLFPKGSLGEGRSSVAEVLRLRPTAPVKRTRQEVLGGPWEGSGEDDSGLDSLEGSATCPCVQRQLLKTS